MLYQQVDYNQTSFTYHVFMSIVEFSSITYGFKQNIG